MDWAFFFAETIEDSDAKTPSPSDSDSLALAGSAPGCPARQPVTVSVDCIAIPPREGFRFQILKFKLVRLAMYGAMLLTWSRAPRRRDLMLQRGRAFSTEQTGASPQSKHGSPPILSHSRISPFVPPKYVGNSRRKKNCTEKGGNFISPSVPSITVTVMNRAPGQALAQAGRGRYQQTFAIESQRVFC